jgi:hypothetical protein
MRAMSRSEAGVHLGAHGPGAGARAAILGQEVDVGEGLGEVLADGERVPDHGVVVAEDRDAARRGVLGDEGAGLGAAERDEDLAVRNPDVLEREPAAERPGRIVLVADGDGEGRHGPRP